MARSEHAFWDASGVVLLCCHQPPSGTARRLLSQSRRLTVWWGTPVEVRGALARLVRERALADAAAGHALARLAILRRSWAEVLPVERVRALAEDALERHALRAADALQLAAALAWCSERPARRRFVCFDGRLGAAAERDGFRVLSSAG